MVDDNQDHGQTPEPVGQRRKSDVANHRKRTMERDVSVGGFHVGGVACWPQIEVPVHSSR